MTDDPRALAAEMDEIARREDRSPAAIARLLDGLRSDATWTVQEERQGLWHDELVTETREAWKHAAAAIRRLGSVATDAVAARIEAGEWRLLARAESFGPSVVAAATRLLESGPDEGVFDAVKLVFAESAFGLADFMRAFDRLSAAQAHVLERAWAWLTTTEGREAIASRWAEVRPWIEARVGASANRARHLVMLLAVAPHDEAMPLLRAALVSPREITFAPLLSIDVARAREVLATDGDARAWAEPIARAIAQGKSRWLGPSGKEIDCALVSALASDEVLGLLLESVARDADGGCEVEEPRWRALAPYVRGDTVRFWRAAQAAIRHQFLAAGPGVPAPHFALRTIGELDPERMTTLLLERIREIRSSKNAEAFVTAFAALGPHAAAAKRDLAAWARDLDRMRTEIEAALAKIDELTSR